MSEFQGFDKQVFHFSRFNFQKSLRAAILQIIFACPPPFCYNESMQRTLDDIFSEIRKHDPRYKEDAYDFVLEALSFTQKKFKRVKHVTGPELLEGIKILLMQRFGPMTVTVLKHWGIEKTEDFGNIVFNLVHNKVLSKTDDDHIDHFRDVYDFDKVFNKGYRQHLHRKVSRLR